MKKALMFSVPLLVFCCACDNTPIKTAEYKAYVKFAKAYANPDCNVLRALAEGKALEDVTQFCGSGPMSGASMVSSMASTPAGAMRRFSRKVESKTREGDSVLMTVLETSTMHTGVKYESFRSRQTVRLVKKDGAWKITEYTDTPVR